MTTEDIYIKYWQNKIIQQKQKKSRRKEKSKGSFK